MANFNFNKVILGGRITGNPELKQTTSGLAVVSFTIAVNRPRVKDKDTQTDFINCVAWRQTAELIAKYFQKGSSICVTGNIQTRSYDDKSGNKKYVTEVVVDEVSFVNLKPDNSDSAPAASQNTSSKPAAEKAKESDDDLPF